MQLDHNLIKVLHVYMWGVWCGGSVYVCGGYGVGGLCMCLGGLCMCDN